MWMTRKKKAMLKEKLLKELEENNKQFDIERRAAIYAWQYGQDMAYKSSIEKAKKHADAIIDIQIQLAALS